MKACLCRAAALYNAMSGDFGCDPAGWDGMSLVSGCLVGNEPGGILGAVRT